ncbi:MAG: hypothetical protein SYR96_14965 [Actinomycetota bacterium]|nr:hypothetical protein [Actinomycetota bacterium]
MDAKTLVKQFNSDPGLAFIEIIRTASSSVRATDIKREIIDAGGKRADVDRLWKRLQPVLKLHPHIHMGNNRYSWSEDQRPPSGSLEVLAGNLLARLPTWLAQALVQNVRHGLDDTGMKGGDWADREFEKARLVADLAVAVDVLRARDATMDEVTELLAEEAQRKRLWPIGRPGEIVPFDPASHETVSGEPQAGTSVEVVRAGYVWRGGSEPVVAAKAVVTV